MEFMSTSLFIFVWIAFSAVIGGRSRKYIYVQEFMKAMEAEAYCVENFNTHLATVETWKENRYIRDTCSPPGAYNDTGCGPVPFISNCACWIGLVSTNSDTDSSRSPWTWLETKAKYDYESGSFENWAGARDAPPKFSQPNDRHGEQGCTAVFKGAQRVCQKLCAIPGALDKLNGNAEDGTWDDRRCNASSSSMHFFCNAPTGHMHGNKKNEHHMAKFIEENKENDIVGDTGKDNINTGVVRVHLADSICTHIYIICGFFTAINATLALFNLYCWFCIKGEHKETFDDLPSIENDALTSTKIDQNIYYD